MNKEPNHTALAYALINDELAGRKTTATTHDASLAVIFRTALKTLLQDDCRNSDALLEAFVVIAAEATAAVATLASEEEES